MSNKYTDVLSKHYFFGHIHVLSLYNLHMLPTIRPSSDLRNKYNEISDFCHNDEGTEAMKANKTRPFRDALKHAEADGR